VCNLTLHRNSQYVCINIYKLQLHYEIQSCGKPLTTPPYECVCCVCGVCVHACMRVSGVCGANVSCVHMHARVCV